MTALLAEIGFESFYEENDCFKAYIPSELLDEQALEETLGKLKLEEPLFMTYIAKKSFADVIFNNIKEKQKPTKIKN